MNETENSHWVQFECRIQTPDTWLALPMSFGGSLAASQLLMAATCGSSAEPSLDSAAYAVAVARFDGCDIIVLARRGLTQARLHELIGFTPSEVHLQIKLAASEAVHLQTRLHPLLMRGRHVPLHAQQPVAEAA